MKRLLLGALALSLVGCASGRAAPSARPAAADGPASTQRGSLKPFKQLVADAVRRDGFFETYEKGDQLFW